MSFLFPVMKSVWSPDVQKDKRERRRKKKKIFLDHKVIRVISELSLSTVVLRRRQKHLLLRVGDHFNLKDELQRVQDAILDLWCSPVGVCLGAV